MNGDVVQVCHHSQWGLVCGSSRYWDTDAARVVCRQVGMSIRGKSIIIKLECCTSVEMRV